MMKQRRRMMIQLYSNLDILFSKADYVTSAGVDSNSRGYSSFSADRFEAGKKYYIFEYIKAILVIWSYLDGTLTELFRYPSNANVFLEFDESNATYTANADAYCAGITVLSFDINMDHVFEGLHDSKSFGASTSSSTRQRVNYTDAGEEGVVRYLFTGIAENFSIYKMAGLSYSDLTPLFNNNITLSERSEDSFWLGDSSSHGYTCLSAKG